MEIPQKVVALQIFVMFPNNHPLHKYFLCQASTIQGVKKNTKPYLEKIGVSCPKCGKDLVVKMTKKGRRYYGCVDYPDCDFMSWGRPVDKKCPNCGGYMVKKGNKIACADAHCGYFELELSE